VTDQPSGSEKAFAEAQSGLYRERPDDFVSARDRLARELRSGGQRDLASRVARLRRPPISLWLANRLSDVAGPQLRDLYAVGGELQQAQASAAAGDALERRRFRELIGRHSQMIDALVRTGLGLAEEHGYGAGEEVGRRLAGTLRAASTEPGEGGQRLLEGRLETELEPGGFALVPPPAARADAGATEQEPRRPGVEMAAQAREARRAATEKERAAVAARSRAEELSRRADALARDARKAREEADAAQEQARAAEDEAISAREAAQEVERSWRS
jgi:hypothetical protein